MNKPKKSMQNMKKSSQDESYGVVTTANSWIPTILVFLIVSVMVAFIILGLYKIVLSPQNQSSALAKISINNELIAGLELDTKLYIDPNLLLKILQKDDQKIMIVDVRKRNAFTAGHINGAVSVPVTMNEVSVDAKIIKQLQEASRKKNIVIYGDSQYDQSPKLLAVYLMKKGIAVNILSIGWNEWNHLQNFWIPADQWGKVDTREYSSIKE